MKWAEYWEFLDDYTDFTTVEGLDKLESFLKRKQEETDRGLPVYEESSMAVCGSTSDSTVHEESLSQDDSLGDLNQQFHKLKLTSPDQTLSSTPTRKNREAAAPLLDDPFQVHKFGNSTMPNSFAQKKPAALPVTISNGLKGHTDGWDSDESCDTFYTAANSPPDGYDLVTPPSSPVPAAPVFIAG